MPENSFKIFNASAGSGKTYMLTKEYLRIILSTTDGFRLILAITFTNKAMTEMKGRILTSLFNFSKISKLEEAESLFVDLSAELNIEPLELQKRAKNTLKKILHNYAFFDISTIDKFTHRLIRTFAKDLKIPQNFEVVLDTNLLLDEAVSRLINKAGQDSKLTKVLIDFALEKIDDDKSWDIAIDLNNVGKLLFNETNVEHLKNFETKKVDDFLTLQKSILKKINVVENDIKEIAIEVLTSIHETGLQSTDFPRETLPNHFKKIRDGLFEPSKIYNNKLEEKLAEGKILKAGVNLPSNEFPERLYASYLKIKKIIYRRAELKNIYKNIVPLTVLNAIQQEVRGIQKEKDQLSISEFNTIISNEIKDQPSPFIYERLGEKYRHFFIDEFQDTSEMQCKNLVPLIDNALASETGSLFLVGDAKQAIYRWRGGNAEQFLSLVNRKVNPFVKEPEIQTLPSNYRSNKEIIKFNNEFFSSTSQYLNHSIYENLYFEGNQQNFNSRKNGLVQLSFISENDEESVNEQYSNQVLQTIHEVSEKGYSYADVCILVRGNKEGVLLANFLTQKNIPVISSESLLINSSPKVQFLINLLRYQNQPKDAEIAFLLLSYLSLEEEIRHAFISNNLHDIDTFFKSTFNYDLKDLQKTSVYDGLEYAIKKFDLASDGDAYINFLMDTVLNVEQKEGPGISTFLSHWEKKKEKLSITAPSSINAVQIMTIHKSKGLEFEIVIFPFANAQIYKEIDPKLWLPVDQEKYDGFKEVLINKKQEVENYNAIAEKLFHEENARLELDAFNVLYVALTRAVKALYIISKKEKITKAIEKPKRYSELFISYLQGKNIWEESEDIYRFGILEDFSSDLTLEEQEKINYQYTYKEREGFKILTKSGVLWDTDREKAIVKGNLIHHVMALIESEKDLKKALKLSLANGDIQEEEMPSIHSIVLKIINHPLLKPYFEERNIVKNEKDIITKNGKILRPDRVVIKENKATIIDYKTGRKDSRYKEQLYLYADSLEEIGYTVENKIIIYINEEITPEFI